MTIRNIDEALKQRLRLRAASPGRSMEDEARDILRIALAANEKPTRNLAETVRGRPAHIGGVNLELPAREPGPRRTGFWSSFRARTPRLRGFSIL